MLKVKQVKKKSLNELPLFFQDKIETLGQISRLTPEHQALLYQDAVRIVHFCQNPIRLWKFQKLPLNQQMELIPGLYRGYGARSRKRVLNEAKLYMRYCMTQKSTNFIRSFWNRFRKNR